MNKIIIFLSSLGYLGYIKYAPGTFGSLVGLLLWIFFIPEKMAFQLFSLIVIFVISIILSSLAEDIYKTKDDQRIIIDEVAGMWISLALLPRSFLFYILGFLLFRLFDVKKPWIIKSSQKLKSGFGVTIDDVLAGLFVNCILQIVNFILTNN
ncbi:MAG: phosphatidylglycerophosphatase A [Endomicrobium sp.]|jgi:phosphatidylglycerophosphatase A|nr:phosphatidylglycerophosphatase A [Endomicrobium sp.]MDR2399172.1 phosphatidylglycerophosphatase A [Endomicrobium sp.]